LQTRRDTVIAAMPPWHFGADDEMKGITVWAGAPARQIAWQVVTGDGGITAV
jgi:hypothetical protein